MPNTSTKSRSKTTAGELLGVEVPAQTGFEDLLFSAFGEAPGNEEVKAGVPFVGPSGRIFNRILYQLNIRRRQIHTDNVVQKKLPGNNTSYLWKVTPKGRFVTHPDWDAIVADFKERVRNCPTQCVVFLGQTPMVAMFGPEYKAIDTLRGYHIWWEDKLIMPTNHPAKAMPGHSPSAFWLIYSDITKMLKIAKHGAHQPEMEIYIPGRGIVTHAM